MMFRWGVQWQPYLHVERTAFTSLRSTVSQTLPPGILAALFVAGAFLFEWHFIGALRRGSISAKTIVFMLSDFRAFVTRISDAEHWQIRNVIGAGWGDPLHSFVLMWCPVQSQQRCRILLEEIVWIRAGCALSQTPQWSHLAEQGYQAPSPAWWAALWHQQCFGWSYQPGSVARSRKEALSSWKRPMDKREKLNGVEKD